MAQVIFSTNLDLLSREGKKLSAKDEAELRKIFQMDMNYVFASDNSMQNAVSASTGLANRDLIIANSGAYAKTKNGTQISNQKIPKEAIEAIETVLATSSSKYGYFTIETDNGFASTKRNLIISKIKKALKFDKSVSNESFNSAKNNAYNLSFQIVAPKAKIPLKKRLTRAEYFARQKGAVDFEEKAVNAIIESLIKAPDEIKSKFINTVDITFDDHGVIFVPKGCGKVNALEKYCKENKLDASDVIIYGNKFDDFFKPVSLKVIEDLKKEADFVAKDFDCLDAAVKLSQRMEGTQTDMNFAFASIDKNQSVGERLLNRKLFQEDELINRARERAMREDKLRAATAVEDRKLAREIERLRSAVPQTLEDGTENPEYTEKEKALIDARNNEVTKIAEQVNKIPFQANFNWFYNSFNQNELKKFVIDKKDIVSKKNEIAEAERERRLEERRTRAAEFDDDEDIPEGAF